jgi:hypothetical protein
LELIDKSIGIDNRVCFVTMSTVLPPPLFFLKNVTNVNSDRWRSFEFKYNFRTMIWHIYLIQGSDIIALKTYMYICFVICIPHHWRVYTNVHVYIRRRHNVTIIVTNLGNVFLLTLRFVDVYVVEFYITNFPPLCKVCCRLLFNQSILKCERGKSNRIFKNVKIISLIVNILLIDAKKIVFERIT